MGLSRNIQNNGEISTFQLLLSIATSLDKLTGDPKALEKAAKESFALSEEEEKKSKEAKAAIATNQALLADQKKQQAELDAAISTLEAKKASIQSSLDSIRKEQDRLAKVDSDLGKRALELDGLKTDLERREKALAEGNQKLADNIVALNKRAESIVSDEKELKAKADKLRSLMDA